MLKKVIVAVSSFLIWNQAFAATNVPLTINVGGSIFAQPFWKVGGTQGTSVTYTFAVYIGGSTANYDSGATTLQLIAPLDTGTNVAFVVPSACTIGGTAVSAANTVLVVGGVEKPAGNIPTTVFSGAAVSTSLRFKNVASSTSGAVSCTAGTLTYTF